MVFIQQESTGRSGEHSRLRDKLLLYNARTRLSQQGVASFVGVSTAALRNWEAGQSKPTAQNLKRLIELYIAYKAFTEGEEQAEAADLWEAAQERGLKVPFDEQWFQELLANQRSLQSETEPGLESGTEASDDRSSTENESIPQPHSLETLAAPSTHKLSRRTVVAGLACLAVGGAAGSGLTWTIVHSQSVSLSQPHWSLVSEMLQARSFFRATRLDTEQILIEGGVLKDQSLTAQSEIFDPTRGAWRKTQGSLKEARAKHTATLLLDGRVLVIGGYGPLQSAELYDPKAETWAFTNDQMNFARARHTATLLQTGEVLITGGSPYNNANTTERYDPKHGTWISSGNMTTLRYDHVAIRLLDGTVLVAGGRTVNDKERLYEYHQYCRTV